MIGGDECWPEDCPETTPAPTWISAVSGAMPAMLANTILTALSMSVMTSVGYLMSLSYSSELKLCRSRQSTLSISSPAACICARKGEARHTLSKTDPPAGSWRVLWVSVSASTRSSCHAWPHLPQQPHVLGLIRALLCEGVKELLQLPGDVVGPNGRAPDVVLILKVLADAGDSREGCLLKHTNYFSGLFSLLPLNRSSEVHTAFVCNTMAQMLCSVHTGCSDAYPLGE